MCDVATMTTGVSILAALLLSSCVSPATPATPATTSKPLRLAVCSEPPVRLPAPPTEAQSRGCVATFTQEWSDPASIA